MLWGNNHQGVIVPQEQEAKQLGGVPWVLPLFSEISSSKGPTENPRDSLEA